MAAGTVARRTVAHEVAGLLDSPEIADLIGELEALRWTGRKGYPIRALVGACLVKSMYAIPILGAKLATFCPKYSISRVGSPRSFESATGYALTAAGIATLGMLSAKTAILPEFGMNSDATLL